MADSLFQTLDLHADGRLRPTNDQSGMSEIAALGDGQEGAQKFAIERRHHVEIGFADVCHDDYSLH
ncbi:hypothetical protein [Xaviernesmea oryzae]|uniref:hypothetical protein n=1 Tax=Xaviernesmea oryzae TaxID=464029 RepID=UPI002D21BC79|nr:hypothetical protein [Xaviernesmea oryzae]